jgi:hypothetical protein
LCYQRQHNQAIELNDQFAASREHMPCAQSCEISLRQFSVNQMPYLRLPRKAFHNSRWRDAAKTSTCIESRSAEYPRVGGSIPPLAKFKSNISNQEAASGRMGSLHTRRATQHHIVHTGTVGASPQLVLCAIHDGTQRRETPGCVRTPISQKRLGSVGLIPT